MGCDIHCYVEHRTPGYDRWSSFGSRINPGRDYDLFSKLAGVRGSGPGIAAGRKFPSDAARAAKRDNYRFIHDGEKQESNYVGSATAERWLASGASKRVDDNYITHPDWHSHSWCTPSELADVIAMPREWGIDPEWKALLAACRALEAEGQEVRVVFWFDN